MRLIRWSFALIILGAAVFALAGVLPFPASAQRTRAPSRVGVLNDARAANHPTVDGLKAGLRDLGLEEGRDVLLDVRLTDADPERMPAAAAALVRAGADVIFTSGEAATRAAKGATQTIPIVFTLVGDPVVAGFVKSLAHPAGNLTGVSSLTPELVPKRLEVLKALAVSSRFGIEIVPRTIRTQDELERIFASLRPGDALLVPDIGMMDLSAMLLETSLARRVPAVFSSELWVSHGGLASYGADYRAQGVQAARLVGKILHGARPGDLPVEGADRIVLAINLKTAVSFGLTAPRQVLFWADIIRR